MAPNCRIWWPKALSASKSSSRSLLFGWFVYVSSVSLDVIVTFSRDEASLSHSLTSEIEEIARDTNRKMPIFLQDQSKFTFLGICSEMASDSGQLSRDEMEETSIHGIASAFNGQHRVSEGNGQWSSGCLIDGLLEKSKSASIGSNHWIQLVNDSHEQCGRDVQLIPKLQQIQWNGKIFSRSDVHVIIYATPIRSSHHFSLRFGDASEQQHTPQKKPKWFDKLHEKKTLNDLYIVILAINCAAAAKTAFEIQVDPKRSFAKFSIFKRSSIFLWKLMAILMASLLSSLDFGPLFKLLSSNCEN